MDNEKESRELNRQELQQVTGGGTAQTGYGNTDRFQEFKNVWDELGLSGMNTGGAGLETEYRKWEESGFTGSAYDFLLPLKK